MRSLVVLASLLATSSALAASATAKLDRTRASLDDEVMLTISVDGSADSLELPSAIYGDFEVQASGTSNQVSFINGRMSSSTRYTYTLVPKRAGTLTVPAIPVTIDGTRTSTEALHLTVAAANSTNSQQTGEELWLTAELVPASGEREAVFVGEQLVYTLRVFARVSASCPSLKIPDFPHATTYDLGPQREYRTQIDGEEVSVVEVRRAVFPDKPGAFEVAGVRMTCTIERNNRRRNDPFGGMFGTSNGVRKVVRSATLALPVEPLPQPAPPRFTGLVGDVQVTASFSKQEAASGDSVTLTYQVRGTADVSTTPEPALPQSDQYKLYDDKPTVRYDTSGAQLISERTFTHALVVQKPGVVDLHTLAVDYFDPVQRRYRKAESEKLELTVRASALDPSPQPAGPPANATPSPPPAQPASPLAKAVVRRAGAPADVWLYGYRLLALIVVPLTIAFAMASRVRRKDTTPLARQRREAAKSARAALQAAGDDVAAISSITRELIGAVVQHRGPAMSTNEALDALPKAHVPAELIAKAHAVLTTCDAVTYGGARPDVYLRDDAIAFARGIAELT